MGPSTTYHFYGTLNDFSLAWGPFMDFFTAIGPHTFFEQGPKISLGGPDHKDNTDKRKES